MSAETLPVVELLAEAVKQALSEETICCETARQILHSSEHPVWFPVFLRQGAALIDQASGGSVSVPSGDYQTRFDLGPDGQLWRFIAWSSHGAPAAAWNIQQRKDLH